MLTIPNSSLGPGLAKPHISSLCETLGTLVSAQTLMSARDLHLSALFRLPPSCLSKALWIRVPQSAFDSPTVKINSLF